MTYVSVDPVFGNKRVWDEMAFGCRAGLAESTALHGMWSRRRTGKRSVELQSGIRMGGNSILAGGTYLHRRVESADELGTR